LNARLVRRNLHTQMLEIACAKSSLREMRIKFNGNGRKRKVDELETETADESIAELTESSSEDSENNKQ
jgi:hypothetical protein